MIKEIKNMIGAHIKEEHINSHVQFYSICKTRSVMQSNVGYMNSQDIKVEKLEVMEDMKQ